jgi:hypothetical protein
MESSKYEHFSHISSQGYFDQILTLYSIEWLREPLLQGLATSSSAGAEGLIRSTRSALIQSLTARELGQRQAVLVDILQVLSAALSANLPDDRYAIPILDLLSFLIDSFVVPNQGDSDPVFRRVFVLVQKAHFRSSNIQRLESAVKVYAALSRLDSLRSDVLKKMTGLLLHPFPRVCLR